MSRNDGFTLIEVMIATAIIGILLAIALPQYQDYTARTQVTSAIQSVGGIKADLLSYMYDSGACTGTDPYYTDNIDILLDSSKFLSAANVTENASNCFIQLTFSTTAVPNLRGKNILFTINKTTSGSSTMICSSPDIDNKYLPPACRS